VKLDIREDCHLVKRSSNAANVVGLIRDAGAVEKPRFHRSGVESDKTCSAQHPDFADVAVPFSGGKVTSDAPMALFQQPHAPLFTDETRRGNTQAKALCSRKFGNEGPPFSTLHDAITDFETARSFCRSARLRNDFPASVSVLLPGIIAQSGG
jgi:hypothetical protein